jgi:hypothetical protein
MNAKRALVGSLVFASLIGGLIVPNASARPGFRAVVAEQFKLADKDGKIDSITCQYCHTNPGGGGSWNKWGTAVREQLKGDAKGNITDALYLALKADQDSDGDGYADALEVVAKTMPGDEKSKPTATVAALEEELKKMGGVDAFKTKAK